VSPSDERSSKWFSSAMCQNAEILSGYSSIHKRGTSRQDIGPHWFCYNKRTGLMLCCPITSRVKGYPFEVNIKTQDGVDGAVLADQVKSLDWEGRSAKLKSKVSPKIINDVLAKALTLLSPIHKVK